MEHLGLGEKREKTSVLFSISTSSEFWRLCFRFFNPMKIVSRYCAFLILTAFAFACPGQTASAPPPTPYSVVHRESNERTWQRTTYSLSPSGQAVPRIETFQEIASGLCYPGQNGQFLDSQELISILPDGTAAIATTGLAQARWPADAFSGPVELQNGATTLSVQPQCLAYSDGTNYIIWATLTNSVAELISSNLILYPNALAGPGGVKCDVLYEYRKSGLEADAIFRKQPPAPEAFGMNSANAKLQLWTALFDSPTPAETPEPVDPQSGLQDRTLSFGNLTMIQGRAFLTGGGNDPQIRVFKEFRVIDAHTAIVVEQVPLSQIADSLAALPVAVSGTGQSGKGYARNGTRSGGSAPQRPRLFKVLDKWILPVPRRKTQTTSSVRAARVRQMPGFVLDYVAINSGQSLTNFVFASDSTFYLSGPAYMYGQTVFQGGVVVKATNNGELNIIGNGTVDCQTGPYLPALFTSYRDSTVGSSVGSGSPAMDDVGTFLNFYTTNVVLNDMHFAYASNAVAQTMAGSTASISLWDCEFVDVATAVNAYNVGLYNVLIGRGAVTNAAVIVDGAGLVGENVTADRGGAFVEPDSGATVALTNCLVTRQPLLTTGSSVTFQTNAVVCQPTLSGPTYQVTGGASYYLTNGSQLVGTANIDPDLLSDLQEKTVWPPVVYGNTNISLLGALGPVTHRDTNNSPSIAFHYPALDFVFAGCELTNGLSFSPGTAVGWFEENGPVNLSSQPYSISLNGGANLSFNGNATEPCIFARYPMVQEGANGNWTGDGWMGAIAFAGGSPEPQLSANFTKMTSDMWNGNLFRDNSASGAGAFKNSEFYNFDISTYSVTSLTFTNCLFYRFNQSFWTSPNLAFENCTFYDGGMYMSRSSAVTWLIQNSSFDGTALAWSDPYNGTSYTTIGYNAYDTNNLSWTNYPYFNGSTKYGTNEVGQNDLMVTNFNWTASWFGPFYVPDASPAIYKGSTNANYLGLYHFTTTTNQVPDGTNVVSIGYHYVSTDQYGNPLDSNGDGIPDYLADPAGNGLGNWDNTMFLNVIITQPQNESTIP